MSLNAESDPESDAMEPDEQAATGHSSRESGFSTTMLAAMLGQYAVMQGVVAATGLVRNKVVALRLGPGPFGEVAQLAAATGVVVTLVSLGMNVGLSRNIAKAQSHSERQALLANANGLVLSLAVLGTGVMVLLLVAGDLIPLLGIRSSGETVVAGLLFVLAIPMMGIQTNFIAVLQGVLDVRGMATQRSIAVIAATAFSVPLVWVFGLIGASVSFLVLNLLLAFLLGHRCRRIGYRPLAVAWAWPVITAVASFGLVSMIVGFAQGVADTAVRSALLQQYGASEGGLLQAPLVLASTVQVILLGSVGALSLTTVSSARSRTETQSTIDQLLRVMVPLAAVALGLLGLLGVPAMIVLYSAEFIPGTALLPYILLDELALVAVWVIGAPLLAAGDRILWMTLGLTWVATKVLFSLLLIPSLGAAGATLGSLLAVALHLLTMIVVVRWRYSLTIGRRQVGSFIAAGALVVSLALVGAFGLSSLAVVSAGIIAWMVYAIYQLRSTGVLSSLSARLAAR